MITVRPLACVMFLSVASTGPVTGQVMPQQCEAVTPERDWRPFRAIHIDSNTTEYEPTSPKLAPGFDRAHLIGAFAMVVVATRSGREDTLVVGTMSLQATPPAYDTIQPAPIIGATDVDFTAFGPVNLAYSAAARDPIQPGVQVHIDDRVVLVLGAANTLRNRWRDAGIWLYVFESDREGFRGRWRESGAIQGYFCARRIHEP